MSFTILKAQLCDGNLGDNIFLDGNFGSGEDNIPTTDPGIAPGYNYITNPPPIDGSYTITNDITPWNFNWGWADIQDNSDDPDGYMMVVNASYDPGLFYEKLVEGLCENTLYEFSADIHNLHTGANLIKPNVSFLLNDDIQFTTGNIPENGKWNSYGFTFTTGPTETSVTLSLANNAPGGNGNDLAIDNISFRACGPEALILPLTVENICEDGNPITLDATVNGEQFGTPSFQWQESLDGGMTWIDIPGENNAVYLFDELSGGTYYYRYKIASNPSNLSNSFCQIISNIKIVQVIPKFTYLDENICEGLEVTIGNQVYTDGGTFIDTLINQLGCDSIVTLELIVFPDQGISVEVEDSEPTCSYSSDGQLLINQVLNTYDPYTVSLGGIESAEEISNLSAGDYLLQIQDQYGCTLDTIITVGSPEEFIINLGDDVVVDLGDELSLELIYNYNLVNTVYQSIYNIECNGICTDVTFLPFTDGEVIVQSISEEGCLAKDTVQIRVDRDIKIYIPNTFTPNGDNINDYYSIFPQEKAVQSIVRFSIYDRWGNRVHHIENANPFTEDISWDGKMANKMGIQGIYHFIAEIEFIDSTTEIISGHFTLTL